jgi:hypothetical protein
VVLALGSSGVGVTPAAKNGLLVVASRSSPSRRPTFLVSVSTTGLPTCSDFRSEVMTGGGGCGLNKCSGRGLNKSPNDLSLGLG